MSSPPCFGNGCGIELAMLTRFPFTVLSSMWSDTPLEMKIPPPETKRPQGGAAEAEFPSPCERRSVNVAPCSARIPPPFDCTAEAWLSLTVESTSVIVPQTSIPAASPNDAGHGPVGQMALTLGTVIVGAAVLPVTTVPRKVTSVPGNVSMPPPSAVASAYPGPQVGTS